MIDVAVVNPLANTYVPKAAVPLGAAKFRERQKNQKYEDRAREAKALFFLCGGINAGPGTAGRSLYQTDGGRYLQEGSFICVVRRKRNAVLGRSTKGALTLRALLTGPTREKCNA